MIRIISAAALVLLAACGPAYKYGTPPNAIGPNEPIGAVIGGGTGALIGSTIGSGSGMVAATAAGAVIGALLGAAVGRSLDNPEVYVTEVPRPLYWRHPYDGTHGWLVYNRDFYYESYGTYCREYHTLTRIGFEEVRGYGTACLMPDGSWRFVN